MRYCVPGAPGNSPSSRHAIARIMPGHRPHLTDTQRAAILDLDALAQEMPLDLLFHLDAAMVGGQVNLHRRIPFVG